MKDIIEFVVVGTMYIEGAFLNAYLLQEHSVLTLEPEPTNKYDAHAIKVMAFDGSEHLGYVSNQGTSCSHCWTHVGPKEICCSSCGAGWDYVVKGGLATRLIMTKSLERNIACFVKSIDLTNKFSPITAKLILE